MIAQAVGRAFFAQKPCAALPQVRLEPDLPIFRIAANGGYLLPEQANGVMIFALVASAKRPSSVQRKVS